MHLVPVALVHLLYMALLWRVAYFGWFYLILPLFYLKLD